jgi:energy-coupling factor transporter ATP-binding protein EcfA2
MSPEAREKFAAFEAYKAGHSMMGIKADEVMRLLDGAIEPMLIFVFGPTGVGKSTLVTDLQRRLIERYRAEMEVDPGRFAHVTVEVPAPDAPTAFSWRGYYADILVGLEDPLVSKKIDYPMGGIRRGDDGKVVMNTGTTTGALSRAMVQALKLRRPGAVILDEAEHLLAGGSGSKFLDRLKVLRSIVNRTRIPHILVGTYELLDFMELNTTLRRRSKKVHMPRYYAESKNDQKAFNLVVQKFQDKLPCSADLLSHSDYLFERSIGCVGLLKVWLSGALSTVLREDRSVMTLDDLESTAMSPSDLCLMLDAAVKGEQQLGSNDAEALQRLRDGMQPIRAQKEAEAKEAADKAAAQAAAEANKAAGVAILKPGERGPARDPIGVPEHESAAA